MKPKTQRRESRGILVCIVMAATLAALPATAQPVASVQIGSDGLSWSPTATYARLVLTVSGEGLNFTRTFGEGDAPSFGIVQDSGLLPDGTYAWELLAEPEAGRDRDRDLGGELPRRVQSGFFRIHQGSVVRADESEPDIGAAPSGRAMQGSESNPFQETQVITQDLVVQGSECVGQDCPSNPSFGFDTFRLQENNLRIHFDDTSTSASFPRNDWRIVANESSNGGASKFSIDDATAGRTPFTITAGAAANSIFVSSSGRVGFKTSTPVVELHSRDGDTPTLRLEQDGSSGFTPQTWDMAGNETNFFVRDVSNGSTLPLRIRPAAPSNSVFIDVDGDVGLGTSSPGTLPHGGDASVHIRRTDGNASLFIEEASSTTATRSLMELANNGVVRFDLTDTSTAPADDSWRFVNNATGFQFNRAGTGFAEMVIEDDGDVVIEQDLTVNGTIFGTVSSSRDYKHEVEPVDARQVLARVAEMPISTWRYDLGTDVDDERHLGPMAEDFHAAFGLGRDEKSISLVDYSGVALAAIQGLYEVVDERDERIEELEAQNRVLLERLERIERRLTEDSQ